MDKMNFKKTALTDALNDQFHIPEHDGFEHWDMNFTFSNVIEIAIPESLLLNMGEYTRVSFIRPNFNDVESFVDAYMGAKKKVI